MDTCIYILSSFYHQGRGEVSCNSLSQPSMHSLVILIHLLAVVFAIPAPPTSLSKAMEKRLTCAKDLPGAGGFEFPHLIMPISKSNPESTYPNTYFPNITPNDVATVFDFDMLGSDQSCELGFYFPRQDQLTTSLFTLSGPGTFTFSISLPGTGAQDGATTWNNQPPAANTDGFPKTINMQPGNYYSLSLGPCVPGLASLTMNSSDSCFTWFQDFNPCPIGPFIVYSGPPQG